MNPYCRRSSRAKTVAIVVLGAVLAACGGDDDATSDTISVVSTSPAGSSTTVSATTAPPSTVPPSTPPTTVPPTTEAERDPTTTPPSTAAPVVVPAGQWSTTCTDVYGSPDDARVPPVEQPALTELGDVPALEIEIPTLGAGGGRMSYGAAVVRIIPGGVLLLVSPSSSEPPDIESPTTSFLVAVDDDGAMRWRRCIETLTGPRLLVAATGLGPDAAWVGNFPYGDQPHVVHGFDLATGADAAAPDPGGSVTTYDWNDRFVLFGPSFDETQLDGSEQLVLYDLIDGSVDERALPPGVTPAAAAELGFQLADENPDGAVTIFAGYPPYEPVVWIDDGTGWTDDADVIAAQLPPSVIDTFDPAGLHVTDAAGRELWAVPGFVGPSGEGFRWRVAGDVVLAVRCIDAESPSECAFVDGEPTYELVAFDLANGDELWAAAGAVAAPIVTDEVAIVSNGIDGGYRMIAIATGETLQSWAGDGLFAQECCGGDEFVWVALDGNDVIAANLDHVRVWRHPDLTDSTVAIAIGG